MDTNEKPKSIWNPAWPKPRAAVLRLLVIILVLLPCEWAIFAGLVGDWKLNIADGTEESVRHLLEGAMVFFGAVSVIFLASLLPVFGWLHRPFKWRNVRRALIGLAVLVTVYALYCTEENIRGKHAWDTYRHEAEARGEQLDFNAFIPHSIPDGQNFAATPLIQSWFARTNSPGIRKGDNYEQAQDHMAVPEARRSVFARQFLDLAAWSNAFAVVQAVKMTGSQKFRSDKLDFKSRAKAAPSVLEGLKTNDAAFAELRAASQRPFSRYPIDYSLEDPAEILLPHLNHVRGACRRLGLKACAELTTGSETALKDVTLILRLADSLKEEPTLISYLVRIACVQTAIQPIWEGLAEQAWSDTQLQELQARLQSYNFVADLKFPLDAERAMGTTIIEFVKRRGIGTLITLVGPGQPTPSDKEVADFFGRIVPSGWFDQEQVNYCRLSVLQMAGAFDGTNKRVYPKRIESDAQAFDRALAGRYPFDTIFVHHRLMSTILLPALPKIPIKAAVAQTTSDQALLACALERYRLANGQFPDTLDALVPQFISSLPHDVITGEPYRYRRTADGQFVLYSVGWNEKDDGGIPGKQLFDENEGDWVWQYPSPSKL